VGSRFPGSDSNEISVAVAAEDEELRQLICAAVVAGGHSVHARASHADDLTGAEAYSPTCAVLGFHRPSHRDLLTAQAAVQRLGDIPLVLMCGTARGAEIRRALELGVSGVVLSDDAERALPAVVGAVCAGQVSVPAAERAQVRAPVLTTREKQILGLVVMGMTNGEIARKLYLAESTVKSHLSSAFSKLGVSSRNEAVSIILDPDRGRGLGILTIPAEPIPSPG
jgi:DNA-binding NarL/FixJ family response regulator